MPFYADSDAFYAVMRTMFQRLSTDPQATTQFQRSKMTIRFRCTEPEAEIYLSGRSNPIEVDFASRPGRVDLELSLPADLLHKIWLGQVGLRDSFFSGQIKTTGNLFRAFQLADLFRQAEALYPQVLEEMGYEI